LLNPKALKRSYSMRSSSSTGEVVKVAGCAYLFALDPDALRAVVWYPPSVELGVP
jgi:hypothetical protein